MQTNSESEDKMDKEKIVVFPSYTSPSKDTSHISKSKFSSSFSDANNESEKEDEEDLDLDICEVCLDGDVYDGNTIIFCDGCDLAVHQNCYGVAAIPSDNWYCNLCKKNLNSKNTPCELCARVGGAYKPTCEGKWVHVKCALRIPEVDCRDPNFMEPFDLKFLNKERFQLKCCSKNCHSLKCNQKDTHSNNNTSLKKEACIQCFYSLCPVAVHPQCVEDSGMVYEWIIYGETALFKVYCEIHKNFADFRDVTYPINSIFDSKFNPQDEQIKSYEFDNLTTIHTPNLNEKTENTSNKRTTKKKPVEKFDLKTGEVIETFASQFEASRASKLLQSKISNCCNGSSPCAGGFGWRFSSDKSMKEEHSMLYAMGEIGKQVSGGFTINSEVMLRNNKFNKSVSKEFMNMSARIMNEDENSKGFLRIRFEEGRCIRIYHTNLILKSEVLLNALQKRTRKKDYMGGDPFSLGNTVETKFGAGVVINIREDGFLVVELEDWRLSKGSALLYTLKTDPYIVDNKKTAKKRSLSSENTRDRSSRTVIRSKFLNDSNVQEKDKNSSDAIKVKHVCLYNSKRCYRTSPCNLCKKNVNTASTYFRSCKLITPYISGVDSLPIKIIFRIISKNEVNCYSLVNFWVKPTTTIGKCKIAYAKMENINSELINISINDGEKVISVNDNDTPKSLGVGSGSFFDLVALPDSDDEIKIIPDSDLT